MPDEVIVNIDLDYDGKRDRYNGYKPEDYDAVVLDHELYEVEKRRKKVKANEEAASPEGKKKSVLAGDQSAQTEGGDH
jgi:pre-mRNA-processing factor SLU7